MTHAPSAPAASQAIAHAVERLVAYYAPAQIYLFGSQAKGQAHAASDIDLLIIRESNEPPARRGRNIKALFATSPTKFDMLFYTPEELEAELQQEYSFISGILPSAMLIYPFAKLRQQTPD